MLYTARTPNGFKVSIFLEELKAKYGLEYESVFHNVFAESNNHELFIQSKKPKLCFQ
jgi:glutathione S-transferase